MSLFFSQISKLSAFKVNNARLFSSSSSSPQSPCLLLGAKKLRQSPEGKIVKHKLFDATTEKTVFSKEKSFPSKLLGQPLLGASQGWVATLDNKDHTIYLTDLYKPSVSSPRVLSLPPIEFRPSTHATEVSLSSSDPVHEEFIVAAKFNEYRLSVCRDSKWTHMATPYALLPPSDLIYSKRDKAFYFTSFKGLYMGTLDLTKNKLKYQDLRVRNLPKILNSEWEILDKCSMTQHLVESPSGDLFFIKWYTQCAHKEDEDGDLEYIHSKTERFMVFREDGEKSKDFCYTEDIGDLCIFLGQSEAFSVSASMFPGLKPNSIYYIGPRFGSYHLGSGTDRPFDPFGEPSRIRVPFWFHPTNPIA